MAMAACGGNILSFSNAVFLSGNSGVSFIRIEDFNFPRCEMCRDNKSIVK